MKEAFALAQACATIGPSLHPLFTQAFAVAKRVRNETEIARHAVSVSFAAVELAKKIFAGLARKAVLLVGAGKMSELAARHLVEQGAFPIYVVNRTWSRAQELARALAGTAVPFEELGTALGAVDIVITSTGAPEPIVTREMVARVVRGRGTRPLFFIDIAVPRDVGAGGRERAVRPEATRLIRLATRASVLALAQARSVAAWLEDGGARVQIVPMRTEGDRRAEARLADVGGKGLFVREIEEALLRG